MPSRADLPCVPEGRFARARWVEQNLQLILENVPLHEGLAGLARHEAYFFPRTPLASDHLGGPLDPTCPECGTETDEGTVVREGDVFRVRYQSCGHEVVMTPLELQQRVRHG